MTVTAKLSKLITDHFGEQIAHEMVAGFDKMEATSRLELRELNELNFARFDAKLEQRIAEVRTEIAHLDAGLERRLGDMTRWMTGMWLTLLLAILATWFRH